MRSGCPLFAWLPICQPHQLTACQCLPRSASLTDSMPACLSVFYTTCLIVFVCYSRCWLIARMPAFHSMNDNILSVQELYLILPNTETMMIICLHVVCTLVCPLHAKLILFPNICACMCVSLMPVHSPCLSVCLVVKGACPCICHLSTCFWRFFLSVLLRMHFSSLVCFNVSEKL